MKRVFRISICVAFIIAGLFLCSKTGMAAKLTSKDVMIGKKVKRLYQTNGRFQTLNNRMVFVQTSGKLYKGGFFLHGKHVFYAAKKTGEIRQGWVRIKGNTYFFSRKNYGLTSQPLVEGVVMDEYGIAKFFSLNNQRVETYLKAAKVYRKITKPTDAKSEKLYKCYKWVVQYPYARHRKMKDMMKKEEWQKKWDCVFANDIFDKKSGCCVSYSAAFALLAKECGYKKVTLCSDGDHSWDDIGGRLFDPLFAKAKSFSSNYNATYSDYRSHAVITKKIY